MMAPVKMIKRQTRAYLLSISKELLRMRSQDQQRMQREERVFIGDLLFKGKELNCEESCLHSDSAESCQPWFVDNHLLIMAEI